MKKLRLDLDELKVESLDTSADGTVQAYDDATCSKQPTCGIASRGEETYEMEAWTRYACCI